MAMRTQSYSLLEIRLQIDLFFLREIGDDIEAAPKASLRISPTPPISTTR